MTSKKVPVVDFVKMIGGQNDHVFRLIVLNRPEMLERRVRGASIDLSCRRWKARQLMTPPFPDVALKLLVPILREKRNTSDSRIEAVGDREIDDAEDTAERQHRLRPKHRQG